MKKLLIVLLLTGCMTYSQKAYIYGVSDVQSRYNGGFYQYRYVAHFSPNIERYTIGYYIGGERLYTYSDEIRPNRATRSVGIPQYFEMSADVPVTIRIRGYVKTGRYEYNTLVYEYTIGE